VVPGFGNAASISPEILFIQCFATCWMQTLTSSLIRFAWWRGVGVSEPRKDISGGGMPFCILRDLSNKQIEISFHVIYTLSGHYPYP